MDESDILTLGWGCEPGPTTSMWPNSEEFVTLDMDSCSSGGESQDYVTLEVCKERDRAFYNSQQEHEKMQEWDVRPDMFRPHQPRTSIPSYNECFYPQYTQPPPLPHYEQYYHPQVGPTYPHQTNLYPGPPFSPQDPRRHATRSPTSGKFVRGFHHIQARVLPPAPPDLLPPLPQLPLLQEKERKRPGPKPKTKSADGAEDKDSIEGPLYDQATIDAAHLTMVEDHYVCSVCKMKFKQPGNARRHIITVHRNEKPHECSVCATKFGRKDKLKTHMIRNHGFDHEDIKKTFSHSGSGRKRSSIVVNRKGRSSTESTSDDERESNPLNLKTYSTEKKAVSNSKHLDDSPSKRSRV